jgi:hypothetical protein
MGKQAGDIDCLLVHVPKFNNYYKPFGDYLFIKYLPLGLLGIADFLDKNGSSCEIVHLGVERLKDRDFSLAGYIKEKKVRLVGLPLYWHYQSYDTIEVARGIKEACPGIFIVLGGFTATSFSSEIVGNHHFIDAVIEGDGEIPMLSLAEEIRKGGTDFGGVPNLVWRRGGEVVRNPKTFQASAELMDTTSYSNFSLLKNRDTYTDIVGRGSAFIMWDAVMRRVLQKSEKAMTPIALGRGCTKTCAWCAGNARSQHSLFGRSGVIYRSEAAIIADIGRAMKYGFEKIFLEPLRAPGFEDHIIRLFRGIREAGIMVDAVYEQSGLPSGLLIDEFAKTFPGPGSYMCLSRESYSDAIREFNEDAPCSNNQLYDTLEQIDKAGIAVQMSFTFASPPEKEADLPALIAFRKELLRKFKRISVSVFSKELEPHSLWFLNPGDYGIETDRKNFADFYRRCKSKSSSYASLGYRILGYFKDGSKGGDIKSFEDEVHKIRCRHFCRLASNYGCFLDPLIGRARCFLLNLLWRMMGISRMLRKADAA